MKSRIIGFVAVVPFLFACSEQGIDPCELLTSEEVRTIAPQAAEYEWHPASTSKSGDNELCLWHDGGQNNVFMLFYFISPVAEPAEIVESGMSGEEARIVEVEGVGDAAAAGFSNKADDKYGSLKLFVAKAEGKTIGIRLKGVNNEDEDKFRLLMELANKALSRT